MPRIVDTWGMEQVYSSSSHPNSLSSTFALQNKTNLLKSTVVPDDWEDDDDMVDTDADTNDAHNKRLWEEANTRESRPMPSVIMSRGFSSGNSLPFNQPPTVHILKRPLPSSSTSPTNLHTTAEETLQDREARYEVARERIFGSFTQSENHISGNNKEDDFDIKPTSASSSKLLRELRGPTNSAGDSDVAHKGFGERKLNRSLNGPDPSDIPLR